MSFKQLFSKRRTIAFSGLVLAVAVLIIAFSTDYVLAQRQPPGNVFMQRLPGETCLNVGAEGQEAMSQTLTLRQTSDLLVYFTFEWGSLQVGEEGLLSFAVATEGSGEWSFAGVEITRTSGTLMYSFADVPRGTHTLAAHARVHGGDFSAELNECAMTVFVIP